MGEPKTEAEKIYRDLQSTIVYLWGRWQDERAYEDFDRYITVAKNALASSNTAAVFEKMTKRPFAATFTLGQDRIVVGTTSTSYYYKVFKI